MKTIHEIVIKSTVNNNYITTISLVDFVISFGVIVHTNFSGVMNEYTTKCDTYKKALHQFIDDAKEYAEHTTLMNL